MMRNIKTYISIAIGILSYGSVLIGYIPIPKYIVELTCISNSFIGIFLLMIAAITQYINQKIRKICTFL